MCPSQLLEATMSDEFVPVDQSGSSEGQAPQSNPADDLAARFEGRLNKITDAVETLTRSHQQSRASDADNRMRSQVERLDAARRSAEVAVATAERALATAIEGGEAAAIARAHRNIAERVVERDKATSRRTDFDRVMRETQQRARQQPADAPAQPTDKQVDDANLRQWKSKHSSWYGVDTDLTKAAHDVDKRIREAGVIPVGSPEYFRAIDMQMAQRYPDRFSRAPDTASGGGGGGGQRQQSSAGGRIPQSVVDGWERMGIDVRDPKVIERMLGHRQTAVEKGILQQQYTRERVKS
jgi:hypothetical protein